MATDLAKIPAVSDTLYVNELGLGMGRGCGIQLTSGSDTGWIKLDAQGVRELVATLSRWLDRLQE